MSKTCARTAARCAEADRARAAERARLALELVFPHGPHRGPCPFLTVAPPSAGPAATPCPNSAPPPGTSPSCSGEHQPLPGRHELHPDKETFGETFGHGGLAAGNTTFAGTAP